MVKSFKKNSFTDLAADGSVFFFFFNKFRILLLMLQSFLVFIFQILLLIVQNLFVFIFRILLLMLQSLKKKFTDFDAWLQH